MDIKELERRYRLLMPHVKNAAHHVVQLRREGSISVKTKEDGSPVTNADIWANDYFRKLIEKEFPGEHIVGEEDKNKSYPAGAECLWYIDPIDGTKNFVGGRDNYFMLIGFCYRGVPSLGIYHKPEEDSTVVGFDSIKTFKLNGKGTEEQLKASNWIPMNPGLVMKHPPDSLKKVLKSEFGILRYPYIDDNVDMLGPLFGQSNGFVSYRRTANWDLCAPAAIMRSAGYLLSAGSGDSVALFNNGEWNRNFFYALPPDSPGELKRVLESFR